MGWLLLFGILMDKANERDGMTTTQYLFGVKNNDKLNKKSESEKNRSETSKILFILLAFIWIVLIVS